MIEPNGKAQISYLERDTSEILGFHSFRALCPVTSQPDHASVFISYTGSEIDKPSLANLLYSYRKSTGFHENWAEQLYELFNLSSGVDSFSLAFYFSRRGGISINPIRYSSNYSGYDLSEIATSYFLLR